MSWRKFRTDKLLTDSLVILVIGLTFFLFAYRLPSSFVFADDFARDVYDILDISRGKLTLLGPSLSFGGLRAGPYYYYLFAPVFFLIRANIDSVLYLNAGLFATALGYFFYELRKKRGILRALVAMASLALLPVYIYGARNTSNGFSYLPLLLFFLAGVTLHKKISVLGFLALGALGGMAANFHFVILPMFLLLFGATFGRLKDKKMLVPLVVGFGLMFLPLVLFEVRHVFVMTKTTWALKDAWLENKNLQNLPGTIITDKYVPNNFFLLLSQSQRWLAVSPLLVFLVGGMVIVNSREKTTEGVFFVTSVASFFLLSVLMRFQFSPHYLAPYALVLIFTFSLVLTRTRWWVLLLPLILVEIFYFPRELYVSSNSRPQQFEKTVEFAIENRLVSQTVPFNVLRLVNRANKVTLGYEYRYFFRLKGFEPASIYEYDPARTLLVFSDLKTLDLRHLGSWEIDQFGRKYVDKAKAFKLGLVTIYSLTK